MGDAQKRSRLPGLFARARKPGVRPMSTATCSSLATNRQRDGRILRELNLRRAFFVMKSVSRGTGKQRPTLTSGTR